MKDNIISSSKLNQYCSIHKYVHNEAYELCDCCLEHKHYLHHRDKYCNYGFSKRNIAICQTCEDSLFDGVDGGVKYRIRIADEPYGIHERICQVIKEHTTTIKEEAGEQQQQQTTIEYFEAVRIAYLKDTQYFIEYFGCDDDEADICQDKINKNFKGLWRLTYRGATILYLSSINIGENITQNNIAQAAGITEVTLRNRLKDLKSKLKLSN